jgi:CubicO group peptidase (beta-lactamase class C family)
MKENFAATILILALVFSGNAQTKEERSGISPVTSKVTDLAAKSAELAAKSAELAAKSAEVDRLLTQWAKADGPGAAVIVIRDGQVLKSKGYGLANRETREPFQTDTPSLIGSVSKQFTAMAVMILTEQGKLNYDDTLAKFFPEFPPYAQKITLRHLLNHTSGLPIFDELISPKYGIGKDATTEDMLRVLVRQQKLRFSPGVKWEYNNGGYVLLSHLIERVSGKEYAQFIHESIFQPLGMNDSFVSYDETKLETTRRAIGYYREWYGLKVSDFLSPLRLYKGAGSLFSTAEDLYKWDQSLYTERLVKASTLEQAFTAGKLNNGTVLLYGFGWELYSYKGVKYMIHPGGWGGFKAFILRFPTQRFTIIALSNSGQFDIHNLPLAITRVYLSEEIAVPDKIVNFQ